MSFQVSAYAGETSGATEVGGVAQLRDADDLAPLVFETLGWFAEHWHGPACRLGLDMLSRVYDHGLQASGGELDELRIELDRLTRHWAADVDSVEMHEYLLEGRSHVLRAIDAAIEHSGYVVIG